MNGHERHLADQIQATMNDTTPGASQRFGDLTSEWFQAERSPADQLALEQELGYDRQSGKWLINSEWVDVWEHL